MVRLIRYDPPPSYAQIDYHIAGLKRYNTHYTPELPCYRLAYAWTGRQEEGLRW